MAGKRQDPSAWISLDEGDDSLVDFLSYFVAGVRTLFQDSCEALVSRLSQPEGVPPPKHLAALLCNDLDLIEQPFTLVLDDYHLLSNAEVHGLIDDLLRHPPRCLHLVLVCRRDPPLALVGLRARNRVSEVRARDLQFTREESARFLSTTLGEMDEKDLTKLQRSTEGWPVALRLVALALRHGSRRPLDPKELGSSRDLQEYLVMEILEGQAPEMRDWLCKTSILNRFCAPLCDAVCGAATERSAQELGGREFLQALQKQGLLCVPLDERREWFRYHHLFQESLQLLLKRQYGADLIATLHQHAAGWLEGEGLIEEALRHLKAVGDAPAVSRLIVRQRGWISDEEHWFRLERWLALAPPDLLSSDPEVMLLKAWSADHRERLEEARQLTDAAEALLGPSPGEDFEDSREQRLRGEIAALRTRVLFLHGETAAAQESAQEALRRLPPEYSGERGYTMVMLSGALLREGRSREVLDLLHEALDQDTSQSAAYRGRVLFTLCGTHWLGGDLTALFQDGALLVRHTEEHRLRETLCSARAMLAAALYQRNRLDEAEQLTRAETTGGRWKFVGSLGLIQAMIDQARGRPDEATQILETLHRRFLESGYAMAAPFLQAYQAELALRQGRSVQALAWARSFRVEDWLQAFDIHCVGTTAAKIFLKQGSAESLAEAERILEFLRTSLESIHYRRFLIDVEALQALVHERRGEETAALAALARAIQLAQPGRFIRVFIDLGPGVFRLLHRLEAEGDTLRYVGEIQAAFQSEASAVQETHRVRPASAAQPLIDPLTPRELEVLACLGGGSNKDIAAALGISSGTVKRHTKNIYEKLAVHSRREAVEKAAALGILQDV